MSVQFAALLDSARGAAEADAKKKDESDEDAGAGDTSDDEQGADRAKSDRTTEQAIDPRMVALVLPFAPPPTALALPTKLSLDAAANGQMTKGTKAEPLASSDVPGTEGPGVTDPKVPEDANVDAVGGANSEPKVDATANPAAAAASPTVAAKAPTTDLAKASNGQSIAEAAKPAAPAKTEPSSIVRAGDLDVYGGSPVAKSAAHATANNGGNGAGSGAGNGGAGKGTKPGDADAKSAAAVSTVSAADLGAAAATAAGAGRDNALTTANPLAPGAQTTANASPDGATTAERAASAQSAANQMVIAHAAHGQIDHPELGRIGVSADLHDGRVDVRVNADRPEAAAALTAHAVHMASDVRAADIPLAELHIAGDTSRGSGESSSFARQNNGKQGADEGSGDAVVQTSILENAVDAARVRIVL